MYVDPVDLGPGCHHLAHRPVGEADDAGDHRPLVLLEHARVLRLGDDQVQFLGGDVVLQFLVEAQRLEDQRAGAVRAARRTER